jgi:predicted ATPase
MLVEWVLGTTRGQPLTIALEDLHWADASTLEVVQLLAEQVPRRTCSYCTRRAPSFVRNGRCELIIHKLSFSMWC